MRKTVAAFALALWLAPLCAAATLPEMFKKAKDEFAAGNYKQSLADFDLLDAESRKPELAADRAKLAPVILFYRGANLAALGRRDDAKENFIEYLLRMPTASIASPPFPPQVVDVFEAARKEAAGKSTTMQAAYAQFAPPAGWTLASDEKWIESPVRYLLSADQKKQYAALTSPADREAFVSAFWNGFGPAFRAEFERRVAFADANYATSKNPGRATDRAAVFTFLGPPTYIGVSQIAASEDAMGVLRGQGNSNVLRGVQGNANALDSDSRHDMRESWYYRSDRLPSGVQLKEVRFDFVTQQGYGTGVMQKEPEPMQALGQAVDAARREKKLN